MRLNSCGTSNGANKLTVAQVQMIRKMRKAGATRRGIAAMVGVGVYTIRDIDYGYTWGWLAEEERTEQ